MTDSFSNWMVYLDEDAPRIELAVGDTITLREFTEWIWHKSEEPSEYKNVTWKMKQGNNYVEPYDTSVFDFTKYHRNTGDDEIKETYDLFEGKANAQGEITLYRVNSSNQVVGAPVVIAVTNKPQSQKPGIVTENIAADIKVNLFDYNTDSQVPNSNNNLDVNYNTASLFAVN